MKWLLILLAILLLAGGGIWYFRQPGPRQLDLADQIFSGRSEAELGVTDQIYDPDTGLKLDIWLPKNGQKPYPVVIFFHGGGWDSGSKDHYGFAGRALAARGFIVVIPDYRLFPKVRFPAFVEDSAHAIAWVHDNIARTGGDPDRLFLAGHSAGAYNAVMVALDRQWLGRLGKQTDIIKGVAALAGPYDFYPYDNPSTINSFGKTVHPELTQPVNFVRADGPPLWLASGADDLHVKPANSRLLETKTLEAGGDVEYAEYSGLDHEDIIMAIAKPFLGKGPVLDDIANFFDRTSR